MDPLTIILAALATAGGQLASQALADGYAGLKATIVRKFASRRPTLEAQIDSYVANPDAVAADAAAQLREAGVDHDEEILEQARQLLATARSIDGAATAALVHRIEARNVAVIQRNEGSITFN
jgi:hypothetical protein